MKRRIMKKKAKMAFKTISGKDETYHNILVYFYKKIINDGSTFYVYTSKPKISSSYGVPYRYVLWLNSL